MYTVTQAAKELGFTRQTILSWINKEGIYFQRPRF